METFLILNGFEIDAPVDEQERVIFQVASGEMKREEFTAWLRGHIIGWDQGSAHPAPTGDPSA